MLNFNQISLQNIVVHRVGNRSNEEGVNFSHNYLQIHNELVLQLLLKYFLSPFKNATFFHFTHDTDLNMNEVFTYASKIFEDSENLFEQSINLAKHLYEKSEHPKIKAGEFYLVYIKDCLLDDEMVDGIGLFKTENKETYLRVNRIDDNFEVGCDDGVNINKLDKGCIILNTDKENGYLVAMVDAQNKNEAVYWKDEFLKLKPRQDEFFQTKQCLDMCKEFIEVYKEENSLDTAEQADIKNKTMKYFTENDNFSFDSFEEEVLEEPQAKKAFKEYKQSYEMENNLSIPDEFEIADNAVKSSKKFFKAVLKLDKNFHVYIHGDRNMVEKGHDNERNMNFYQLFYEEES